MARQPNPPPDKPSLGREPSIGDFLSQVRHELDRFEQEMAARESRLAAAELQLEEARKKLEKEQAAWTARQGREHDLARKLEEAARQLAANESLLKDRDEQIRVFARNNQTLREQVTQLTRQAADLQAELKDTRQQVEIQTRRAAGLEKQVALLKTTKAPEPARPGPVPSVTARPGGTEPAPASRPAPRGEPASPWMIGFGVAAVLVSAILGAWSYASYKPLYFVSGHVKTRPGDAPTLAACAHRAKVAGLTPGQPDVERGLLTFWLHTRDTRMAVDQVNDAGREMVALFGVSASGPASRPAATAAPEELLRRIAAIDRQLAATTRPATRDDDEGARLVARWMAAEAQRREVDVSLASLASASDDSAVDPASIQIDPAEVQAAEKLDPKLQADIDALHQRDAELGETLKKITDASEAAFKTFDRSIGDATARIERALKEDYGPGIREDLQVLNRSLATWKQASAALAGDWAVQRDALFGGADRLACQSELDRAARHFIDAASGALVQFRQTLDAMGQDTDEPTKGLVLSRALTKDLQPAVDAQQETVRLARSATLNGNLDLATMVQRVSALRKQVGDRRTRIEASMRAKTLASFQDKHEQVLKAQREQLNKRAADLDREIRQHIEDIRALVRRMDQQQASVEQWAALQEERAEALRSLARVERRGGPVENAAIEPAFVEFVPARIEPGEAAERRTVRALLVGFGSLLIFLVGWLAAHGYQTWQRNRRAIEACTRELQVAARK